jgi:hypothetical protein
VVAWDGESPFVARIYDQVDNPVAWEEVRFTLQDTSNFPGYIGLREMSVPSVLDTSVVAISDPSGAAVVSIIGPGLQYIQYAGAPPSLGYITVPYEVNLTNHGNIQAYDSTTGGQFDLEGDETSEDVTVSEFGIYMKGTLGARPVRGTVKAYIDDTSSFDLALEENESSDIEPEEFYIDDLTGEIYLVKDVADQVRVTYNPRLAWLDEDYSKRIYFGDEAISDMTSDIIVNYDAKVSLEVVAGDQTETYNVVLRAPE